MAIAALCALGALVLWIVFRGGDKPTELDADVWAVDPDERALNLIAKKKALRTGLAYQSIADQRRRAEDLQLAPGVRGPLKVADPNREEPPRRLVRHHPMRPATWE